MSEIEKVEVKFPMLCHLVARNLTQGGSSLFLISLYTVLSCVEMTTQSCRYVGCQAIALPSTEQIV